jgi:hypothetical protein
MIKWNIKNKIAAIACSNSLFIYENNNKRKKHE